MTPLHFVEIDTNSLGTYDQFVKTCTLLETLGWEKQETKSTRYPEYHWASFLYDPERDNYTLTMEILDILWV